MDSIIGQRLALARRAHGLSQSALGARCGLSVQRLSDIERGRRGLRAGSAWLNRLSSALDIDPAVIVG